MTDFKLQKGKIGKTEIKRVNREWSYIGLRNQGTSMIPGSEPILLDLEKLFLLPDEQISKE